MIKLIASDIDGTLVKDGTLAIDREYMEVIRRLIDKGIVFVACSGRQYRSERKLFTPVADRLLYISDGGTVVRTPKEILKVDTLPDEIWKGMCSMVRENMPSCDYFISTPERCFAEDGGSQMFHWLRDSYGYDIHEVPEMLKLEGQQVNKFAVYHPVAPAMTTISVTITRTGMSAMRRICSTGGMATVSLLHLHLLTWLTQSDLKPRLSHQAVMDGLRSKEKSAIRTGQKAQDISKDITV